MLKRFLIVTVGGQDEPIVTSIKHNKPDFVYFICSADLNDTKGSYHTVDGPGKPCKNNKVNIVEQTGLIEGQYKNLIVSLDDLNSCYLAASETIKKARDINPDAWIIADYTGGTKSMAAGLAAAAMDDGNTVVCIVNGLRVDTHQVKPGTQSARIIDSNIIFIQKKLALLNHFWNNYDYQSCLTVISDIYSRPHRNLSNQLDIINYLCQSFDAWDRFDHYRAIDLLKIVHKQLNNQLDHHIKMLGEIKCVIEWWPDQQKKYPSSLTKEKRKDIYSFMPVLDLVLNAQRRNSQRRFDDAVARLYRALEMFGQLNLLRWEHPLNTSDLNLDLLPQNIADNYSSKTSSPTNTVTIGLMQAYTLLSELNNPVGLTFDKHKNKIRAALNSRNSSLMAHGITPVSESDCQYTIKTVIGFIEDALASLGETMPDLEGLQFPISLLEKNKLI